MTKKFKNDIKAFDRICVELFSGEAVDRLCRKPLAIPHELLVVERCLYHALLESF